MNSPIATARTATPKSGRMIRTATRRCRVRSSRRRPERRTASCSLVRGGMAGEGSGARKRRQGERPGPTAALGSPDHERPRRQHAPLGTVLPDTGDPGHGLDPGPDGGARDVRVHRLGRGGPDAEPLGADAAPGPRAARPGGAAGLPVLRRPDRRRDLPGHHPDPEPGQGHPAEPALLHGRRAAPGALGAAVLRRPRHRRQRAGEDRQRHPGHPRRRRARRPTTSPPTAWTC